MLKKLKKINETPIELEKLTTKYVVEVVPQTATEFIKSELTTTQDQLTTNTNLNVDSSKICSREDNKKDKLKTVTNQNNTNLKNNSETIVEKSLKVVKRKPFIVNQKSSEILVTDALKKLTKKSVVSTKEKPVQFVSNPNEVNTCSLASQGSVIIDKQLSVAGPFKKVKCVYTILNNDQINTLRKHAQEAVKQNKIFTIRGNYNSVRHALKSRGWVEKLEMHRKSGPLPSSQINICDLSQVLPKRKMGETQRQFIAKVERNIMSRYIENVLCDLLWTPHKEKADYMEQSKNPSMLINKFNRAPFTNKENLNAFLRDMTAFYEEGVADIKFPRCFNVWSPEELNEFIDHFKLTACIAFVRWLVDKYGDGGFDAVFSATGKIPYNSIDFAFKRCLEYIDNCQHNDIDVEDPARIWEHDWDAFLHQHYQMTHEGFKILADPQKLVESVITRGSHILDNIQYYWPQYSIDGYQNLWIIKPANKCRGRGIHLSNNLKKIVNVVNPSIATKSRYVVQKYMERPLIIHHTKFDIRQWFLISSIHPLMVWMYKECYLRFSSQEYTLTNHHESVHLTNHAIQKKYTNNGKRDKRLPNENMWDSYSFQAYLRQIGKQEFWLERIYPGMRKAIVASVLVSQDHMERTPNTFELFGADFMICENFYPWLIEINSNPDLAASTSVTARMCPQCLEDVIKVMIDRRNDAKADVGNFELIYRQNIPPTPAYMGLNLIVKGKQISNRSNSHHSYQGLQRKERSLQTSQLYKHRTSLALTNVSQVHKPMPAFNATEFIEKCMVEVAMNSPRTKSVSSLTSISESNPHFMTHIIPTDKCRKSFANLTVAAVGRCPAKICSAKSSLCSSMYSTLKRHRSCGPRLSTNCVADCKYTQKSKFFVASYNQQKALHSSRNVVRVKKANLLDTPVLTISKSADNIKELCSPLKKALKCTKSLSPMMPAKKNANNSKSHLCLGFKTKSDKGENNANTIHAIGKSISNWNINKRQISPKTNV
ncbi:tubulin glycylase 3A [Calliphora vicina]|uniref:tubulin glycylase 3A n=1 Tax=Calliphora vicina TaxID=7373 RepID=UPI00325ADC53